MEGGVQQEHPVHRPPHPHGAAVGDHHLATGRALVHGAEQREAAAQAAAAAAALAIRHVCNLCIMYMYIRMMHRMHMYTYTCIHVCMSGIRYRYSRANYNSLTSDICQVKFC